MEEAIRISIRDLKKALDRMDEKACAEIQAAGNMAGEIEAFWKYAKTILKISNVLDESEMMTSTNILRISTTDTGGKA